MSDLFVISSSCSKLTHELEAHMRPSVRGNK